MTHKELLKRLAEKAGCTPKEAEEMLAATGSALADLCGAMDAVAVPGFGTFTPVKCNETVTTDAVTGKTMLVPPSISLSFHPSVLLRKQFEG